MFGSHPGLKQSLDVLWAEVEGILVGLSDRFRSGQSDVSVTAKVSAGRVRQG